MPADSSREKYGDPDLDDREIDALSKYFKIDGYPSLLSVLRKMR
jgi:hypothetical protein